MPHTQAMRFTHSLLFPALLLACGVKLGDDQDPDDAASSSGGGTVGVSGAPTTGEAATLDPSIGTMGTGSADPPDDSHGGSTAVDTGDTQGTITTNATSVGETEGSTGAPGVCEALCAAELACGIAVEVTTCEVMCHAQLGGRVGECASATAAALECFAGLDCELLAEALTGMGATPCSGAAHARDLACEPEACNLGAGGDEGGSFCMLSIECPREPLREMNCDAQTCVCEEDGVMTGSCEAMGVCDDLAGIQDFGLACCGFAAVGF